MDENFLETNNIMKMMKKKRNYIHVELGTFKASWTEAFIRLNGKKIKTKHINLTPINKI